ncbi:RES domain-containing protein [Mesorhizobium sp. M0778]|uniref:RES domain-containing protein n=1 Tax=Mesorhizobium sp. M0778 TaxID=2956999 RepID=UPI00333717D9
MKVTRVGPDEIFHRYLTPKWGFPAHQRCRRGDGRRSFQPARHQALYLSRSAQTALEEYKQGASITPPATLAAYKITLAEVVDLSQGFDPDIWDGSWKEWDCAWRQVARIDKKIPPSWKLADLVITAGLAAFSFRRCVTPAAPTWWSFRPILSKAIGSRSMIPITGCRTTSHPGRE